MCVCMCVHSIKLNGSLPELSLSLSDYKMGLVMQVCVCVFVCIFSVCMCVCLKPCGMSLC